MVRRPRHQEDGCSGGVRGELQLVTPQPAGIALFPPLEEAAARVRGHAKARQIALTRRAGRYEPSGENRIEVSGAEFTFGGNSDEPGPAGA
jgi:hypothetical protein